MVAALQGASATTSIGPPSTLTLALAGPASVTTSVGAGALTLAVAAAGTGLTTSVGAGRLTLGLTAAPSATVTAGTGALTSGLALSGTSATVTAGGGRLTLGLTAASTTVTVGSGTLSTAGQVALSGTSATVTAGGGRLNLALTAPASVTVTAGTGTLVLAQALAGTSTTLTAATGRLTLGLAATSLTTTTGAGTLTIAGPPDAPDAILAATNLGGTVRDLWDPLASPDTVFLGATDPTADTDLRVSFPTPAVAPPSGGPQTFRAWVRRTTTAGAPDPTLALELWEGGTFRAILGTVAVTSTTGQLVEATMDPADLLDPTGATAELRLVSTAAAPGPLVITTGGTYSGTYVSTDPTVPAVRIATTAAVTLDRATIRHAGFGVFAQSTVNVNLTMTNSQIVGLDPGDVREARAVYLLQPASVVIEHNQFTSGQGILFNGNDTLTTPLRIRYNEFRDLGRWDTTALIGAVHFDQVLATSGAEIAWNRIVNRYGRAVTEDVIGMHESDGGSSAKIDIHHNLIDGSYPYAGDGAGFTGGGIDLGDGDAGGSWQVSHDNTVVRVTNNGLMIPNGHDLEHYGNRVVTSGIADNGTRVSSEFGAGVMVIDNPSYTGAPVDATIHDNAGDHRRWNGTAWERSWQYTPACNPSTGCGNNTNAALSLTTDAAWLAEVNDALADWETARATAGVTVGPVP